MAVIRPSGDTAQADRRPGCGPAFDVMNTEEARQMVEGNHIFFLAYRQGGDRSRPRDYLYDPQVYQKAQENMQQMINQGVLQEDQQAHLYIIARLWRGRSQTGIVACCSMMSI
jgi:uncharacterized protein (DUF1015 family)